MKRTSLFLSAAFPYRIGFVAKVRIPAALAMHGALFSAASAEAEASPALLAERIKEALLGAYTPPSWFGYFITRGKAYATDGDHVVPVKFSGQFLGMVVLLQEFHFQGKELPIISMNGEPSQILLHDRSTEETFLEPYECGLHDLNLKYKAHASSAKGN